MHVVAIYSLLLCILASASLTVAISTVIVEDICMSQCSQCNKLNSDDAECSIRVKLVIQ